jgi:hypothetical protein
MPNAKRLLYELDAILDGKPAQLERQEPSDARIAELEAERDDNEAEWRRLSQQLDQSCKNFAATVELSAQRKRDLDAALANLDTLAADARRLLDIRDTKLDKVRRLAETLSTPLYSQFLQVLDSEPAQTEHGVEYCWHCGVQGCDAPGCAAPDAQPADAFAGLPADVAEDWKSALKENAELRQRVLGEQPEHQEPSDEEPIRCDYGDECPGHASPEDRPCGWEPDPDDGRKATGGRLPWEDQRVKGRQEPSDEELAQVALYAGSGELRMYDWDEIAEEHKARYRRVVRAIRAKLSPGGLNAKEPSQEQAQQADDARTDLRE